MKRALAWLCLAAVVRPPLACARSHKFAAIDAYCEQIKDEFRETVPVAFSGPDPWAQVDGLSTAFSDDVLAYVYAEGPAIRWVELTLSGPKGSWTQVVDYYFREDGTIAKRERFLRSLAANIDLQQVSYYKHGSVLKEHTHHHPLGPGREEGAKFDDPGAPVYLTVDELPFPDTPDYWRQLARSPEGLIDVPDQVLHVLKTD